MVFGLAKRLLTNSSRVLRFHPAPTHLPAPRDHYRQRRAGIGSLGLDGSCQAHAGFRWAHSEHRHRHAQKIKIPDVAVFLLVGMLIRPEVLGLTDIKADSALNQVILLFGASYILFDGGASLRFSVLKSVWITIVALATAG